MNSQDVIGIAKVSQYLWNDAIPKENAFFGGTIDPRKAIQLYMERKALEYGFNQNLSTQDSVSLYVYALCGSKLPAAMEIISNGSSGSTVIIGGGGGVRQYFAYASVGAIDIVFPLAVNSTIISATRGGVNTGEFTQNTPINNQVRWNSVTGTLTVASSVPFALNEEIKIVVK
jgi:hypothetical protein